MLMHHRNRDPFPFRRSTQLRLNYASLQIRISITTILTHIHWRATTETHYNANAYDRHAPRHNTTLTTVQP